MVIHFSTVFKALDTFVAKHNATSDSLSARLRQPVIATAREIIRIYGASLLRASKQACFDTSNIPSLKTNNVQLAKISHVSTRTIQRHLKKLLQANIITEKIWHGSNASYELYLNPKILLINGQEPVNNSQILAKTEKTKSTDNQFFKNEKRTNCPHTDSSNNSYINNILIGVHKKLDANNQRSSLSLTAIDFSGNKTGNNFSRYTEKEGAKQNKEQLAQDTLGARNFYQKHTHHQPDNDTEREGKSSEATEQAKDIVSRFEASSFSSFNFYVDDLWKLAKNTLYENVFLTKYQEKRAKELLRLWYEPVEERNLDKVHKVYVKRIGLVCKYIAKDPQNRFVQLPNRYFDPTNTFGFTGTKVWYENQMRSKQKTRLKLITHAQIRRFLNNEQKQTEKQKPRLPLFYDCEKKIQKLGNPKLLDQFYEHVLKSTS
ncbi:hypothetical protein IMCC3317_46770 [Kordia antarctica]|uniref:Uncharacterized protein n=1 Tax=Kordia antarctica TaxID=1218801 RepID=A0A7L4ZJ03_9FLAO|nr:hypothetical protein [Kordia antarctica]QHI36718.1 hypothetical protein IMCC3317_20880 [Kordia antarctica]QHI39272.1 hypothetical protein IMCC3317_46770 [Kordia antarctica]